MANIAIKDLKESTDLDHEAMTTISGGARLRRQPGTMGPAQPGAARIVDFPWNPGHSREPRATRNPSK
jgi:hypothetical protein